MAKQDLKPVRSKEEAKERGKKGGIASGRTRAKKKNLKETLKLLLEMKYDVDGEMMSGYESIGVALLKKAQSGDVSAINSLRDTIGEKPTDKVELDSEIQVVFEIPRPCKGEAHEN